jgi:hypothetical protein
MSPSPAVLVRTWSARHRGPVVPGGYERSCSVSADRRSQAVHCYDLARKAASGRVRTPQPRWRGSPRGTGCRGTILPMFCPTDLHRAVRTRITLNDQSVWTPAERASMAQADEPGRTRTRSTRLKTARNALPRLPVGGLPTRQVVTENNPHPSPELGAVAVRPEPHSSVPAVPCTCPNQRSTSVANGQQRSGTAAPDLH